MWETFVKFLSIFRFMSGDEYVGNFCENVPHGEGDFLYENGDSETVVMEGGARHGLSR